MATYYEWTVEFIDEHADIFDSDFSEKLEGFSEYVDALSRGDNYLDGNKVDVGLVATDSRGRRTWAYLELDGDTLKLPDCLHDSGGVDVRKVPKRFHAELEKVLKSLKK